MQSIIKRILPILILGILIDFSASSLTLFKANDAVIDFQSVTAAQTSVNNKEISSKSGDLLYLETPEEQNFVKQKWQLLKGEFQWDIYEILVGTFLSIIGLAAITLALFRWIPNDLSLISFGMFCFLYGARTNAFQFFFDATPLFWGYWKSSITYIVPVTGYVFFEQILGKGWKSSIRLMIYVSVVFAIGAISVEIALKAPYTAMLANNFFAIVVILVILVNLFWPGLQMTRELKVLRVGSLIFIVLALHANLMHLNIVRLPLSRDLEPLGFLIFIGCLTYIVVRRFFDNEKKLVTITYELETARQIQSFILPQKTVNIKGIHLATHYVPMASVAGDFYDFARVDEKRLGILVADVSGHGVPASLISSMVKIAFVSHLSHASNPAQVLAGINQTLCGKLESDFVTAGYLFIDTVKQNVLYAGAGHPPLLLWRGSEQKIYEFRKQGIILGQFEDAQYQNIELELRSGDRFFLYTDGIIETTNAAGIRYGKDQFKEFITSHASLPVGHFADEFIQRISSWSGKHSEDTLDDDLTLIVAGFENT